MPSDTGQYFDQLRTEFQAGAVSPEQAVKTLQSELQSNVEQGQAGG